MKIEYHHSDTSLHYQSYRKSINDCPHCDFVARRRDKSTPDWLDESQVRIIVFTDGSKWYKKGYAVIVSECPMCFKKSFHHWPLDSLLGFGFKFLNKEIIQKEIDRLVAAAKTEWERSLCFRCAVPHKNTGDEFGWWIECGGRHGPPSQPDEKEPFRCKRFKEAQ